MTEGSTRAPQTPSRTYDPDEVMRCLLEIASLKIGDSPPEWLPQNEWADVISKLCGDAAAEIDRLKRLVWSLSAGKQP